MEKACRFDSFLSPSNDVRSKKKEDYHSSRKIKSTPSNHKCIILPIRPSHCPSHIRAVTTVDMIPTLYDLDQVIVVHHHILQHFISSRTISHHSFLNWNTQLDVLL
jgi:hypothetical protein